MRWDSFESRHQRFGRLHLPCHGPRMGSRIEALWYVPQEVEQGHECILEVKTAALRGGAGHERWHRPYELAEPTMTFPSEDHSSLALVDVARRMGMA